MLVNYKFPILRFAVIFISYQPLTIMSDRVTFTAELLNDVAEPGNHYGTPAPDVFMLADPLFHLILTLRAPYETPYATGQPSTLPLRYPLCHHKRTVMR